MKQMRTIGIRIPHRISSITPSSEKNPSTGPSSAKINWRRVSKGAAVHAAVATSSMSASTSWMCLAAKTTLMLVSHEADRAWSTMIL